MLLLLPCLAAAISKGEDDSLSLLQLRSGIHQHRESLGEAGAAGRVSACPGEGDRYGDYKCNHDSTHRVCAKLKDDDGSKELWGNQDFWELTGQTDWSSQVGSDSSNPGGHWCICMWATADLIKKVQCENVHFDCHASDIAYMHQQYDDAGTDLSEAKECVEKKCNYGSLVQELTTTFTTTSPFKELTTTFTTTPSIESLLSIREDDAESAGKCHDSKSESCKVCQESFTNSPEHCCSGQGPTACGCQDGEDCHCLDFCWSHNWPCPYGQSACIS